MKSNFNENLQEDLVHILGLFDKLLKLYGELFEKSQVLVSSDFAKIAIFSDAYDEAQLNKSRELLGEDSIDYMRLSSDAALRRSEVAKVVREILRKLMISGCALYGSVESTSNAMIIEFGLQPNDPLGAESALIKLIEKKNYENAQQ